MKTKALLLLIALLITACGAPPADEGMDARGQGHTWPALAGRATQDAVAEPVVEKEPQGREETRNIRNTEKIGVSGDAIANKMDGALQANEQRNEELRKAEEAQNQ